MVLRAYLLEAGYPEETRHTADIDGNWNSDSDPSAGEMTEKLQKLLKRIKNQFSCKYVPKVWKKDVLQDLNWQKKQQEKYSFRWILM